MTVARVIRRSLADVIEQFELDGDVIVTPSRIAKVLEDFGLKADPRRVAYLLQRDGWLGSLRTRGAWEFLPAARGGPYSSGDRFLELRAQLAVQPKWPGVLAMESAASVLGLAQRLPEREVLALPEGVPLAKALAGEWRTVALRLGPDGQARVAGLPSWNLEGLIVGIATRPAAYRDTPGLGQWLTQGTLAPDADRILRLLATAKPGTRQRAAYLLKAAGAAEAAHIVVEHYPATATAWLGPRRAGGRYDPLTKVSDTMLARYLDVGGGA